MQKVEESVWVSPNKTHITDAQTREWIASVFLSEEGDTEDPNFPFSIEEGEVEYWLNTWAEQGWLDGDFFYVSQSEEYEGEWEEVRKVLTHKFFLECSEGPKEFEGGTYMTTYKGKVLGKPYIMLELNNYGTVQILFSRQEDVEAFRKLIRIQ